MPADHRFVVLKYLKTRQKFPSPGNLFPQSRLLRADRIADAIKVFSLNAELYPASPNVFDSLADAYEKAGDKARTLENCLKALQLDPGSEYEKNRIRALQSNQ